MRRQRPFEPERRCLYVCMFIARVRVCFNGDEKRRASSERTKLGDERVTRADSPVVVVVVDVRHRRFDGVVVFVVVTRATAAGVARLFLLLRFLL